MKKKIKRNWKSTLILLTSAVAAGVLFDNGWVSEFNLVVIGLGGFVGIILLVVTANIIIQRNYSRIKKIYENKRQIEED